MYSLLLSAVAFAQQSGAPAGGAAQPQQPGFPSHLLFTFAIIAILFYFMLIKPQRTEQRKREELLNAVAKGDDVVTSGGILGTVESVTPEIVTINVAPKVNIKIKRSAIVGVEKKKSGGKAAEGEGAEKEK